MEHSPGLSIPSPMGLYMQMAHDVASKLPCKVRYSMNLVILTKLHVVILLTR